MSTASPAGRKPLVMSPETGATASVSLLTAIPVWFGSAALHILMILGLLFLFWWLGPPVQANDSEIEKNEIVEEIEEDFDLTNMDLGLDTNQLQNLDIDRIEDVTVNNPVVDPTEAAGIPDMPTASPQNIPNPAGFDTGAGAAPLMAESGTASPFGDLGGGGGFITKLLGGRSGSTRNKLLAQEGGNKQSEVAVANGLNWLALHQAPDGHWSLHEYNRFGRGKLGGRYAPCGCGGTSSRRNDIAATAFGLLPYLGSGITHKTGRKARAVDYTKTVDAGLDYLRAKQGRDGSFSRDMYAHGLATIAMCEAYGLTSDPVLRASAQYAVNFIVKAQHGGGGWRYSPGQAGDTSVTGWQLMALKSGQMAGLSVPRRTLTQCAKFLDSCESATKKGTFGYTPGRPATPTMTSVGLLCRQYLGTNPKSPAMISGVKYLQKYPPAKLRRLYYLYYATQVMHHMGGDAWEFWNLGPGGQNGIRDTLIKAQDKGSQVRHQLGSWPTTSGDQGRMMSTSLSLLCLEVYYRHLPLYRRDLAIMK